MIVAPAGGGSWTVGTSAGASSAPAAAPPRERAGCAVASPSPSSAVASLRSGTLNVPAFAAAASA
eukprot:3727418-Prymnesium_polylepis.1